jgi:hypothetical protein
MQLEDLVNDSTHAWCIETKAYGRGIPRGKSKTVEFGTYAYVSKGKKGFIGLDPRYNPVFDFHFWGDAYTGSAGLDWEVDPEATLKVRIYAIVFDSLGDDCPISNAVEVHLVTALNKGSYLAITQNAYNPRVSVFGKYQSDEDDETTTADDGFEKVVGYFTDAECPRAIHDAAKQKLIEVRSTDTIDLDIAKVINMGDYKDMWRGDIFRFEDRERGRDVIQSVFVSGVVVKSGNGRSVFSWKFTNIQDPVELKG